MAPLRRVGLEPHGRWCRGILRQGMPHCHRPIPPVSALWECHPAQLSPAAPLPAREGSVGTGRAWGLRAARGAKPFARRQPDAVSPVGFAGGQELRRRPLGQPGRTGLLPRGSGNGQPGREERRRTLSKLLHSHGCGKMTFPWRLEPGETVSSGAGGGGLAALGSPRDGEEGDRAGW